MTNLTSKEIQMLVAFINEGKGCNGSTQVEHLLEDNMTWMNADDLKDVLGWSKQAIGGVMASLQEKGMIDDSGESVRDRADNPNNLNDWTASQEGVRVGWPLAEDADMDGLRDIADAAIEEDELDADQRGRDARKYQVNRRWNKDCTVTLYKAGGKKIYRGDVHSCDDFLTGWFGTEDQDLWNVKTEFAPE